MTRRHGREFSYTVIDRVLFGDSWTPWVRLVLAVLVLTLLMFAVAGAISWLWPILTASGLASALPMTRWAKRRARRRSRR